MTHLLVNWSEEEVPPTLLAEAPTEALGTGALEGGAVRDPQADSPVLTGIDPAGIGGARGRGSAGRVHPSWWQRGSSFNTLRKKKNISAPGTCLVMNSPSGRLF